MQNCPYGSGPKNNAPPGIGIVYYSDLGIPNDAARPEIVKSYDGRNVTIDGSWLANKVLSLFGLPDSHYNLFPLNEAKDPIGFCERPPTINDVAPGLPEYLRYAVLYEMQRRWRQWCECLPPPVPPGCSDPILDGRGQCTCAGYMVTITCRWQKVNNVMDSKTKTVGPIYGPLSFYWTFTESPYGDAWYPKLKYDHSNCINGQIVNRYVGSDWYTDMFTNSIPSCTYTVDSIYRVDGLADNCCVPGPKPPTPNVDPFNVPDNIVFIPPTPEDDLAIILVQCLS